MAARAIFNLHSCYMKNALVFSPSDGRNFFLYITAHSKDLISNSPNCLPYSSTDVSLENLVLDQLVIPSSIFLFIHITCLDDIVLILLGEITSWSLMGVKGLKTVNYEISFS